MSGAANDDEARPLNFPELVRIRRLLKRAGERARITEAEELRILEALARGDKVEAERIRREVLAASLARALDALLKEHGV